MIYKEYLDQYTAYAVSETVSEKGWHIQGNFFLGTNNQIIFIVTCDDDVFDGPVIRHGDNEALVCEVARNYGRKEIRNLRLHKRIFDGYTDFCQRAIKLASDELAPYGLVGSTEQGPYKFTISEPAMRAMLCAHCGRGDGTHGIECVNAQLFETTSESAKKELQNPPVNVGVIIDNFADMDD